MPPRKQAAPKQEQASPPFYEATQDLWITGDGAMPARAFAPGDRVLPELLATHPEWAAGVRMPAQFAVLPVPPAPSPDGGKADDKAGQPGAKEE